MEGKVRLICGMLAALLSGLCIGVFAPEAPQEAAVAAFSGAVEENMFVIETPAPANTFSIEVISTAPSRPKRVLIYHSHTYEAYEQTENRYQETERWRTADSDHNVVRVGEELAALLRSQGLEVVHDTTAFEPPTLSSAYTRSLHMLEDRLAKGERYDLYIDLHRDAYSASYPGENTVLAGGQRAAKVMLLIGKGEGQTGEGFDIKPEWQKNLAVAQRITDELNAQVEGICRDVHIKSGRFNQHVAVGCILIEAGNNQNTLQEVLCAMPYLADAIVQSIE